MPPNIEWIIPQMAVDAKVSNVLKLPPIKHNMDAQYGTKSIKLAIESDKLLIVIVALLKVTLY